MHQPSFFGGLAIALVAPILPTFLMGGLLDLAFSSSLSYSLAFFFYVAVALWILWQEWAKQGFR